VLFGPKASDDLYFKAFASHAEKSVSAAKDLVRLLEAPGTAPDVLARAIKEREHEGDTLTHDTMKALHETWITPLDRYDIHALMSRLDDVLDNIEATSERIILFEIRKPQAIAVEMAQVNEKLCEEMSKVMGLLKTISKSSQEALSTIREMNRLESESDALYRKALVELYKGTDPFEVMKWREIYEFLEGTADAGEEVGNVVEGIVLEYA
jgi:hypothetical protein